MRKRPQKHRERVRKKFLKWNGPIGSSQFWKDHPIGTGILSDKFWFFPFFVGCHNISAPDEWCYCRQIDGVFFPFRIIHSLIPLLLFSKYYLLLFSIFVRRNSFRKSRISFPLLPQLVIYKNIDISENTILEYFWCSPKSVAIWVFEINGEKTVTRIPKYGVCEREK